MMSVDKVQSKFLTADEYKLLTEDQKIQYALATSKKEKKQLTIQFRQASEKPAEAPVSGTVVEKSDVPQTPETEKTKKGRQRAAEKLAKEIADMKAYAEKYKADSPGVGKNLTLTAQDELSPDAGTILGNNKAFKDDILKIYMDSGKLPNLEELKGKYGEASANAVMSVLQDLEHRKTHFATHDAYIERQSWRTDKRAQLDDGAERSDFKDNNTLVKNDKVKEFIEAKFKTEDGRVDTQKLKDFVFQHLGTDFEANYGIHRKHNGGFGQDEYRVLMEETGLNRRQARKLVEAAGGFSEKSDKAGKVIGGTLIGAGVGSALGSALGAAVGSQAKLTAEAEASVTNSVTGDILAHDYAKVVRTLTDVGAAAGAGLGGIIGGVVGMGATAILYHYDGKRDVMNGYTVEQAVHNPELMLKGLKNPSELDEVPAHMINILKEAGVPEREIVDTINVAKGNATGTNVNINELVSAVRMLEEKYSQKPVEKVEEPKKEKVVMTLTPEIEVKDTEETHTEHKPVERYGYERKPGEYWFGIAQNMYQTADGKPIDAKTANAIAQALKKSYNIARNSASMPKVVELDYEVEVNGQKYNLIDVSDPAKFKRIISDKMPEKAKTGIVDKNRGAATRAEDVTTYGYEATVDDEKAAEAKGFKTPELRDEAAQRTVDSLKQVYPPIDIVTEE